MKRIYFAENAVVAHHVKSLLHEAGIPAEVTGDTLAMGAGIGPSDLSVRPSVWVNEEEHLERALEIVRNYEQEHATSDPASNWDCAKCGETLEGSFEICWNCGVARDDTSSSDGD